MKEIPKNLVLMVLLIISVSFLVSVVSASDSTTAKNNFVYTAISDDDSYAAKSTSDSNIYFFDNSKNAVPWTYNIGRYISSIAISPDGRYVAVGCDGGLIYLFDQQGNVLWKKPFGDAAIKSISFSKDGNNLDVSNALNQAFYIGRNGNLADRPASPAVAAIPSATLSSIPKISAPTDILPVKIDTTGFFGNNFFVWVIFVLIVLVIIWAIYVSHQKTGPKIITPPPQQNGMIYVESIPYGASIYIDGTYVGVSPLTRLNVLPGIHTLKATLKGYHSDTQQITIKAGQTFLHSPALRKLSPSPQQNGMIYVESIPYGAAIYVDGTYAGVSPLTRLNVLPGIHTLKATLNGYHSDTQRITINPGQTAFYSPNLRKLSPPPSLKLSFRDLIIQLGAKTQQDREEAQKQLIIKVNTEGKSAIQQIIKELEKQPSGVKREIVNLLYYLSKESHDGQKVTEELINALTYSSPEVKWLIIQTLGRLKDKRALAALEAAVSDTDFLVKYWAIISLKSIQES
jgi:hypothetical protein